MPGDTEVFLLDRTPPLPGWPNWDVLLDMFPPFCTKLFCWEVAGATCCGEACWADGWPYCEADD